MWAKSALDTGVGSMLSPCALSNCPAREGVTTGSWVLLLCSAESWTEEAVGANGAQWSRSTPQGFRKASGGEGVII